MVAALVGALLVDTHSELQAAWRSIVIRNRPAADLVELGRVPLDEAEALQLAATRWKDPAARNQIKIEWQSWAQAKYKRLRQLLPDRRAAEATPAPVGHASRVPDSPCVSPFKT